MAYEPTYSTADMSGIVVDVLGTGGVELKSWIPLVVLGFALLIGVGAIVKMRRAL